MSRASSFAALVAAAVVASLGCDGDEAATPAPSTKGPGEPTPGCGDGGAPKGYLSAQTIVVEGDERRYELSVPEAHDGTRTFPLVFVFHGSGGTGASIRAGYALEGEAAGGAIFVYPDGIDRAWNLEDPAPRNRDIKLFDALVEHVSTTYCVDKKRIFATGYSNGGYFSNQLGCRRGGVLRAVASHAGGGPFGGSDEYDDNGDLVCPEAPVAALVAHGTDDGAVALDEGQKSREHWRRVNGCKTGSSPYDPAPCVALAGCARDRPVVYCEIGGLGHAVWPEGGAKATWKLFSAL